MGFIFAYSFLSQTLTSTPLGASLILTSQKSACDSCLNIQEHFFPGEDVAKG